MSESPLPLYLSPSQISSLLTCGEQYRLTRVEKVPERPQWASIGGSAVHRMTEDLDRLHYAGSVATAHDLDWESYWNEALDNEKEHNPEFDPSEYRASGRASKEFPDKENPAWWHKNGPKFVQSWVNWRNASGLHFAEVPNADGELIPAIELEVWAEDGPLSVRSFIDRVFVDDYGHWYIVDLKSGSFTPAWPQQLLLNALGLRETYPGMFDRHFGHVGFWKARDGGVKKWNDTADYPDFWLWEQIEKAREIRNQHLFVAQPTNLCTTACGVAPYCVAISGASALEKLDSRRTVQP